MPDSIPVPLGVYEKTLPTSRSWDATFAAARDAGYSFLELAIDASAERQGRLDWSSQQRSDVRAAAAREDIRIRVLTLSAHREDPWGSAERAKRERAAALAHETIGLAADLGAECVQIAGYFSFEGPRAPDARARFLEGLRRAHDYAGTRGVRLAIENVDGRDVTSVSDVKQLIADAGLSDIGLYIDVGNLAGNGRDVVGELRQGLADAYCVQLKDARPGEYRRVPFGEGSVPFADVFDELVQTPPPLMSVEMWNDTGDPLAAADAARWIRARWAEATARAKDRLR